MTGWPRTLVWLPLAALLAFRLFLMAASLLGHPPFWTAEPLTLSEAVAFQDGGEVARLLATGLDPDATYPVRRGAVRGRTDATPLEAAEAAGRTEIVPLLRDAGATR